MSSPQNPRKEARNLSRLRKYFDELRSKFPSDHSGLDAMARSFEIQLTKPAPLFSMFTTLAGIEYLFVVYRNGQIDLFATIYSVHLGTFSLFQAFPEQSIFDYPCAPEAMRRQLLANYVKYVIDLRRPAKAIVIFGTTSNLGHHLWNEWCGKISAELFLDPHDADWVVAANDYLGEVNGPGARRVMQDPTHIVHRGRIYRFSSLVVAKGHREAFRRRYGLPSTSKGDAVCLQLRFGARRWPDMIRTVPYLISELHERCQVVNFVIDGSARTNTANEVDIDAEIAVYEAIKEKLHGRVQLSPLMGRTFAEKVPVYDKCRYFISQIGSGGIIPAWFLAKPGLAFGNPEMYEWVYKQEALVPEGGPFFQLFPVLPSMNGSDHVEVDWAKFADAVVAALR